MPSLRQNPIVGFRNFVRILSDHKFISPTDKLDRLLHVENWSVRAIFLFTTGSITREGICTLTWAW